MFWEGIKLCLGMGGGMAAFDFSILHIFLQSLLRISSICSKSVVVCGGGGEHW